MIVTALHPFGPASSGGSQRAVADGSAARWWLPGAGLALLLLVVAGAAVHKPGAGDPGSDLRQAAFVAIGVVAVGVYFAASARVLRFPGRGSVWLILAVAAAMRLVALAAPPFLSTDVYRYVWDGRVQVAGFNPYLMVPADPALRPLRDGAIYPNINRADYAPTLYPPMAQLLFHAVVAISGTRFAMKLAMTGFDVLAMLAAIRLLGLAGLDRARVLIYAWNPLVVWEFAGNAHVDAAVVGLVALAMLARVAVRRRLTGLLLGAAILTKLFPVLLFPAFWRGRGRDWRMPVTALATVAVGYLLYADAGRHLLGFLPGYVAEENLGSGGGIYWLDLVGRLVPLPAGAGRIWLAAAAVALAGLGCWMMFLRDEPPSLRHHPVTVARDVAVLMTATVLAVTPHYPWYFVWLALPSCLAPYPSVIFLSAAAIVQYHDPFHNQLLQFSFIYLPFLVLAWRDLRQRRTALVPARSF